MLTTYPLSIKAFNQAGAPLAGLEVFARLVNPISRQPLSEVTLEGLVVTDSITSRTNAQGLAVLNLVPTTTGLLDARYLVQVLAGQRVHFEAVVDMPAMAAQLAELIDRPPVRGEAPATQGQITEALALQGQITETLAFQRQVAEALALQGQITEALALAKRVAARSPIGPLIAESGSLAGSHSASYAIWAAWTITSVGLEDGFFALDGRSMRRVAGPPPRDDITGFVMEALVGDQVRDRAFSGWGPANSYAYSPQSAVSNVLRVGDGYNNKLQLRYRDLARGATGNDTLEILTVASSHSFPANTRVKIYYWQG